MKCLILICCLLVATKCYAQSDTTKWVYYTKTDEMTSKVKYFAKLASDDDVNAFITVRQTGALSIMLSVDKAVFNMGVNGMNIRVKFDDNKPETYYGTQPDDGSFDVMFIVPKPSFLKKLKANKKLIIEVGMYADGYQTLHFNIAGLKWDH